MARIRHSKTTSIADFTQEDIDAGIARGQYPEGTTLDDVVLSSDWNDDHEIVLPFTAVTPASGTHTLNFGTGQNFTLNAVAVVNTIATSNIPATAQYGSIELVHSGSATQSIAWGGAFRFTGTAPSIPTTAGRLQFYYAINSAGHVCINPFGNLT
jgi:hypothetical protein